MIRFTGTGTRPTGTGQVSVAHLGRVGVEVGATRCSQPLPRPCGTRKRQSCIYREATRRPAARVSAGRAWGTGAWCCWVAVRGCGHTTTRGRRGSDEFKNPSPRQQEDTNRLMVRCQARQCAANVQSNAKVVAVVLQKYFCIITAITHVKRQLAFLRTCTLA